MNDIVIASNNQNKIKEIREILKGKFGNIFSLKDKDINVEVVEDADSFFGNALKKAKTISLLSGEIALADDSGLMVDALGGAPGVYSARYAGEHAEAAENNLKLLDAMKDENNRKAKFVSCLVLYYPNGEYKSVQAEVDGEILRDFEGINGFGYDSLFYCYELKKSFGEAEDDEKNTVSHRKRAIEKLLLTI